MARFFSIATKVVVIAWILNALGVFDLSGTIKHAVGNIAGDK